MLMMLNVLGGNINTTKKNVSILSGASREVGIEVNRGKTKYMVEPHHQNQFDC
jgi:hypothetical protein